MGTKARTISTIPKNTSSLDVELIRKGRQKPKTTE